jgi:hypothetical protein
MLANGVRTTTQQHTSPAAASLPPNNFRNEQDSRSTSPNNHSLSIPAPVLQQAQCYLRPIYLSIYELYYEWYGLETYHNKPIAGGFNQLEKEQGSKWRKHFRGSEKKHISRVKAIIRGIEALKAEAVDADNPLDAVLSRLDGLFIHEMKKSISKLASWMQAQCLVKKFAARGKNKYTVGSSLTAGNI